MSGQMLSETPPVVSKLAVLQGNEEETLWINDLVFYSWIFMVISIPLNQQCFEQSNPRKSQFIS